MDLAAGLAPQAGFRGRPGLGQPTAGCLLVVEYVQRPEEARAGEMRWISPDKDVNDGRHLGQYGKENHSCLCKNDSVPAQETCRISQGKDVNDERYICLLLDPISSRFFSLSTRIY